MTSKPNTRKFLKLKTKTFHFFLFLIYFQLFFLPREIRQIHAVSELLSIFHPIFCSTSVTTSWLYLSFYTHNQTKYFNFMRRTHINFVCYCFYLSHFHSYASWLISETNNKTFITVRVRVRLCMWKCVSFYWFLFACKQPSLEWE